MIFELFISFSVLACIFIFLGYYTKPEIKVLAVLGFATLFFMGLLLQFGNVTIKIGQNETFTYPVNSSLMSSSSLVYQYQTINDSTSVWIGRWLSIVSALGIALVFSSNSNKEDD